MSAMDRYFGCAAALVLISALALCLSAWPGV